MEDASEKGRKRLLNRRTFLGIVGAAGAAAGCARSEPDKLIPYLVPPEHIVPGMPLFYRTVCRECGAGCGVTARTREGRAVKLEGNPDDPISRGALCARGQAGVQRLYAPDRLREPMSRGADGSFSKISWDDAMAAVQEKLAEARTKSGAIRLLTRPEPGSAGAVQRAFLASLGAAPESRVVFDPFDPAPLRAASLQVFGRAELPVFDLSRARSIVSFGADFVDGWISPVELSRGLASGRGKVGEERTRLTWIGPRLWLTGVSADTWLPLRAGTELPFAVALLHWICDPANAAPDLIPEAGEIFRRLPALDIGEIERQCGAEAGAVERLGRELSSRRPSAVLGPGFHATAQATPLAATLLLINAVLGNVGRTVLYGLDPLVDAPNTLGEFRGLLTDLAAGKVSVLFVHHADPLGTLPQAVGAAALERASFIVSFSDRLDATTRLAHLVLPDNHTLESFGEIRPRKGIVALAQPVMNPLGDTKSASQTLLDLLGALPNPAVPAPADTDFPAFMKTQLGSLISGTSDEEKDAAWRAALEKGGLYAPAEPEPVEVKPEAAALLQGALAAGSAMPSGAGAFDLLPGARGSGDGDASWSWLNELPDPLTTISWSGWVELSPAAARSIRVESGDVVSISTAAGKLELPAYVYPGLRDDAIAVARVPGTLALFPAVFDETTGALAWLSARVNVERTGQRALLPRLEGWPYTEGREIVRTVSAASPKLERPEVPPGMYPLPEHPKHRWAMAIDLDRCTGCQACIVACYAENNVPVNGPVFASRGRNQEWLRLERYYAEEGGKLRVDLLLMLCQHCTNAPCEPVCPTYAAYHTGEGLNAQVYNRCVGTRYCSNNCPYKVRVFNWRDPLFPEPLGDQLNPDVTVRSKGVMEKCTFCVQRIRAAEIAAEGEHRDVADGEVTPACAQTCPAGAIVFGDAKDPNSRVSKLAADGRAYNVLEHLATVPAITYLARVRESAS